jgi:hypothetical protein
VVLVGSIFIDEINVICDENENLKNKFDFRIINQMKRRINI